jgi:inhibitor of KinA sporulation pathway (predicted exonuclease)
MAPQSQVTEQHHLVIVRSAEVFQEGVNAMNSVYNAVFSAGDQLRGAAMVSTAGATFAGAVTRWVDDFNNVKNLLQAMHDQLLSTTSQTISTNQANAEMAAAMQYRPPTL